MDQKLLFLINREWTSASADRVMALLSSWGAWMPIVFVALLGLLIKGGFHARAFVLTAALIVGINDGLVARSLKRLVDRPRPHQTVNDVRIVTLAKAKPAVLGIFKPAKVKLSRADLADVEGRSFPSSHTMNMFSAALVAVCFYRWRATPLVVLAALVAYSRIYTGSHWPSDVAVSILLAFGTTLLLLAALDLLWRRRGAAWVPRLHTAHPSLFAA